MSASVVRTPATTLNFNAAETGGSLPPTSPLSAHGTFATPAVSTTSTMAPPPAQQSARGRRITRQQQQRHQVPIDVLFGVRSFVTMTFRIDKCHRRRLVTILQTTSPKTAFFAPEPRFVANVSFGLVELFFCRQEAVARQRRRRYRARAPPPPTQNRSQKLA